MHLTAVGQPLNANLTALAGLTLANNKGLYSTGAGALATYDLSAFGRTWGGLADASAARTALSLVPGTDVQAFDADLSALAGLSSTGMIARTGSGTAAVRTLTGTANQVSISNGDGVSGNPTFSLPQSIHTAATPTFADLTLTGTHVIYNTGWASGASDGIRVSQSSAGVATWDVNATGTTLTDAAGRFDFEPATGQWRWYADREGGSFRPHMQLETDIASGGTTYTDTTLTLFGRSGTGAVSNYFSAQVNLGAIDGTSAASSYGVGSDGSWTNGGGFGSNTHFWLFDTINSIHVIRHAQSDPFRFEIGDHVLTKGVQLQILGREMDTEADGAISAIDALSTYDKNNTDVRAFSHVRFKPTFNFGGSNTNTTVYGLHLDSTNTDTTGLTYYPLYVAYGGSARLSLSSAGLLALTGSQTISGDLTVDTNTLFVDSTNNRVGIGTAIPGVMFDIVATSGAPRYTIYSDNSTGAAWTLRKGRGTEATPFRVQGGDTIGTFGFAGFRHDSSDSTLATGTGNTALLRAVALESYTSTNLGTHFEFRTTAIGANSLVTRAWVGTTGVSLGTSIAARGTTDPTNALNIFDGTAPVGTLTNGVTLHSASGKLKSVDAAGLAGWVVSASAANSVSPTSPNRTLTVEVNGTTYYIHCKTTND